MGKLIVNSYRNVEAKQNNVIELCTVHYLSNQPNTIMSNGAACEKTTGCTQLSS